MTTVVLAAAMGLTTGCQTTGGPRSDAADGLPTYRCVWHDAKIDLDGRLDEPVWKSIEPMPLRLAAGGKDPVQAGRAKAFWTDDHLYIAFECHDDDIWGTLTEHDAAIHQQEVVEAFIDDNGDRASYIEIEVSPRNTVLDLFILNRRESTPIQYLDAYSCPGLATAVYVDGTLDDRIDHDQLWTCEIAIPWTAFITAPHRPPAAGDVWTWNLYRIDRPPGKAEYSAWSPPGANDFHRPDRFGRVVFVR